MSYDLRDIQSPRLAGNTLRTVTRIAERPVAGRPVRAQMRARMRFERLAAAEVSGYGPSRPAWPVREGVEPPGEPPDRLAEANRMLQSGPGARPEGSHHPVGAAELARAYREGRCSPVGVAEVLLDVLEEAERAEPPMRLFIAQSRDDLLGQARASAERHREGRPRSYLDGVPVAVKDEVDMVPYPTTVGTSFLGTEPAAEDATSVRRLREAGALLVGKANMQELGLGVTGLNPHHGPVRNPWDPSHGPGGSSSGPAAAVAAELCPLSLGADGGGSIRIPAALCGLVGLKPTWGRVPERGAAELCWSVAHLGPIGHSAADVAAAYAAMGGPDPAERAGSGRQPALHLDPARRRDLRGVRLGVYTPWFEHADEDVVAASRRTLAALEEAGATVVEVEIPGLEEARLAHLAIIATEMANARARHGPEQARGYGWDVRLNLALAREIPATDYIQAGRVRAQAHERLERVFDEVDAVITPATGCTAPRYRADAFDGGESDLGQLDRLMRFAPLPNLTGHPAAVFPAGYDGRGLPVGLQAIGRGWDEAFLLRLAGVAEQAIVRRRPMRRYPAVERALALGE